MKAEHFLANESERLRVLNSLALRGTDAPDPALASIVRLARQTLGCAFAGVSVVDAYRQWFAATDGLTIPETSRAESLCGRAILSEDGLIVADVRSDPRFTSDALSPYPTSITFYAGMPIHVGGHPIGSLCVIDQVARELDAGQRGALRDLATLCGALLDARRPAPAPRSVGAQDTAAASLTAVLQAIPDLWFVLDAQGRYLECSDASHPALTRPYRELHGRPFGDAVPDALAERAMRATRNAIGSGQVQRLEYEIECLDGAKRHFEARISPMPNQQVLYVTRDVTELRRREREVRILQRALEAEGSLPVCVADAQRRDQPLIYVNPAFERLTGYARHELLGRNCRLLQGRDTAQDELEKLRVALAAGKACTVTLRNERRDGSSFMNELHVAPVHDASGRVTHFIGMQTDVTQRLAAAERLAASEALYRSVAVAITDGLCVVGSDGGIVAANPAACAMLRAPEQALIGKRLSRLGYVWLHEDGSALPFTEHPVHLAVAHGVPCADRSVFLRHPDGDQRLLRMSVQSIAGNATPPSGVCLVTFRDITDRRRAEQALRDKQAAELANRAKTEFLSRVSHEMRTPLNAVIGFTQLLRLAADDASPATVAQYTGHVLSAGEHLLALINDLLDLQRLEGGDTALDLRPLNLKVLVQKTLDLLQPLARQHDLVLQEQLDPGAWALADAQGLRQVLINIVSNAIKYNRPGGWVCVTLLPDADDHLVLAVEDNGVGMSPEQMQRLFQPFERLGQEASAIEGSGLGLLIARRLVEEMGGRLTLSSLAGSGTLVRIELPRAAAAAGDAGDASTATTGDASTPDEAHAAPRSALRMLYVEDNRINAILFEEAMRMRGGVELQIAEDGAQALALAQQWPAQVLVLDAHLPDMNGHDLLAQLRTLPAFAETPAFMCSADASAEDVQRARDAGFVGYWTKPIDIAAVMRDLDSLALQR
jgi:PAS domain S-box-containing protein